MISMQSAECLRLETLFMLATLHQETNGYLVVLGLVSYAIILDDEWIVHRHVDQLRKKWNAPVDSPAPSEDNT